MNAEDGQSAGPRTHCAQQLDEALLLSLLAQELGLVAAPPPVAPARDPKATDVQTPAVPADSSARPTTPSEHGQHRADLMTDLPAVPEQHQSGQPRPHRTIDRTISATCQTHGAQGFCNLRVTKTGDGIVLNPHVAGACVITLDETGTAALRDLLIEWQGWQDHR